MNNFGEGYNTIPMTKVDLKSKTGLRDALVSASKGIPVTGTNIIQREFLNRVINHANYVG